MGNERAGAVLSAPRDAGNGGIEASRLRFQYRREQPSQTLVKSAFRALEVLELLDDLSRPATVTEIAERLGFPQSSTSMLLRTLTAEGYLETCDRAREYYPSARVALLGSRARKEFVTNGPILCLMNELNEQTGATTVLAARTGIALKYINVLQNRSRHCPHVVLGSVRPLTQSPGGMAILSMMGERDILKIATRIHAEAQPADHAETPRCVLDQVLEVKRQGYFFGADPGTGRGGNLAVAMPDAIAPEMSLTVGGPTEQISSRRDSLCELVAKLGRKHLGVDLIAPR